MITTTNVAPVNLVVRFATELAALAALGCWGFQLGASPPTKIVFAVALPLAMGTVWGAVIAPRAWRRLSDPARLAVELGLFATAAVGVAAIAGPLFAVGFGVVAVLNIALMFAWDQRQIA